jgi:hypothetical protein
MTECLSSPCSIRYFGLRHEKYHSFGRCTTEPLHVPTYLHVSLRVLEVCSLTLVSVTVIKFAIRIQHWRCLFAASFGI